MTSRSSLVSFLPYRESRGHMLRTKEYMKLLINSCKNTSLFLHTGHLFKERAICFSVLHDIGKNLVPKHVLHYPGKLNEKDMQVIFQHPGYGISILDNLLDKFPLYERFCKDHVLRNIILFHHERYNGFGYPLKLKGRHIPLEARFMAIADVYDAMVSSRCYKESFSPKDVSSYIMDMKGEHFDPEISETFWAVREDFASISRQNEKKQRNSQALRIL